MIRYFHPVDEDQFAAHAPIAFDEDTSWWAGVQKCAATIALTATIAATALSTAQASAVGSYHQDDPAGKLFGQYDEDFWTNPVAPVPATLGRLYLPDPEEISATTLRGQPDEDFWQSGVAPTQPWIDNVFRDDDVAVPQPAALQVDDLYWQNPVAPIKASNLALYLPDAEEIPAASLFGQPDEDFWQNPVRPVSATLAWPNPAQFEQHDPAGSLFGQYDEDFWSPLTSRWAASNPRLFSDDDVLPTAAAPAFAPDEDYWASSLGPSTPRQVSAFSDDDLSFTAPTSPALDEDFWQLARTWTRSAPALALPDDTVVVPQLRTDEDFWIAPPARVWPPPPKFFADDDIIVPKPPGPFVAVEVGIFIEQALAISSTSIQPGIVAAQFAIEPTS